MSQTPPEELKYMSKCSTFFVCFPFGGLLACHVCALQYLARVIAPLVNKACEAVFYTDLGRGWGARNHSSKQPARQDLRVPTHFWTLIQEFSVKVWQ